MKLLEYKSEKIYVRPILDNAAKVLQLNAHMKNISVRVQSEENFSVYADKEMMEFVVRNLISNAIKFSHRNNVVLVKAYGLSENKIKILLEAVVLKKKKGQD